MSRKEGKKKNTPASSSDGDFPPFLSLPSHSCPHVLSRPSHKHALRTSTTPFPMHSAVPYPTHTHTHPSPHPRASILLLTHSLVGKLDRKKKNNGLILCERNERLEVEHPGGYSCSCRRHPRPHSPVYTTPIHLSTRPCYKSYHTHHVNSLILYHTQTRLTRPSHPPTHLHPTYPPTSSHAHHY